MKSSPLSKGMWVLVLLGLVVVAMLGIRTISNSDFWMHLALGRQIAEAGIQKTDTLTFTAEGVSWVNASWLYDRVLFTLWTLGSAPLVILWHTAAVVLAFIFLIPVTRKWAGGAAISLALVLGGWLLAARFTIGPHIVALPLAAVFVLLLSESRKPWVLWSVLLPVQVIWANVHSSFILGPIICALFAIQYWFSARAGDRAAAVQHTRALWLAAATLLASVVNPYGLKLYADGLSTVTNGAFKFVQEWISPFSAQFPASSFPKQWVTLALFVGAGGLIAEKRNLPIGLTTLAVASAFLSILFPRNIEWLALLAFPFLALSLDSISVLIGGWLRSIRKTDQAADVHPVANGLAVALAILSILAIVSNAGYVRSGSASVFGVGTEYALFPHAAAKVIARPDFPARVVNLASDGGFLAWEHPARRIFVDQRADLFGVDFYRALNKCLAGEDSAWKTLIEKWKPDAAIINCTIPFAANAVRGLLQEPSWALVYFDGTAAIVVRAVSENEALIQDAQVQAEGLQLIDRERQRVMKAARGQVSPRLIGAGELFLALGRYSEEESICRALVNGTPMMGRAWINLGVAQAEQGKLQEAIKTLRMACQTTPKDVFAWVSLYRVTQSAGLKDESQRALGKAMKLNSRVANLFLRAEQDTQKTASKPPAQ